ncbi:hypothetical protein Csa_006323 [Cucumis sativus]|uniref:Uncharacterized protein n=1 Tax=Cucumis sativus TaxID=3659 RepID=A0A0A0LLT2_CUCSA|nr:hypothetical protein Csa_006323 [Cucumis sativus]
MTNTPHLSFVQPTPVPLSVVRCLKRRMTTTLRCPFRELPISKVGFPLCRSVRVPERFGRQSNSPSPSHTSSLFRNPSPLALLLSNHHFTSNSRLEVSFIVLVGFYFRFSNTY